MKVKDIPESKMNIEALKTQLQLVMPMLSANLSAAYREYMNGEISAGAYRYVLSRHEIANDVLQREDVGAEEAYRACAPCSIDLKASLTEMEDKPHGQGLIESWWQCYRDAGFTEVNPIYDFPSKPQ